jgi:formylglycine-generating enzyme required for sulfatase activity
VTTLDKQEMKMNENAQEITERLLEFFPIDEKLSYDDFASDEMVRNLYRDRELVDKYDRLISVPWTEISWEKVKNTNLGDLPGTIILLFLSPKSFAHVFPSLLVGMVKDECDDDISDDAFGSFLDNHLNLYNVTKDWEKDFYFSLHDDVKRIISLILHMGGADKVLESYWHTFRDTAVPQETTGNYSSPDRIKPDFTLDGISMAFRRIEAGCFRMGSRVDQRYYDMYDKDLNLKYNDPFTLEKVHHLVHITRPFYMGQYPVTQAQWLKVMGDNPSYFVRDDDHPVDSISWNDAQAFIAKLNTQEGWLDNLEAYDSLRQFIARLNEEAGLDEESGYVFRLPTEAEWEYACRAISETDPERETKEGWRWFFGDDPTELEHYAWFEPNAEMTTHPVGEKRPNPWGLYDLYGNVWEWVWDYFGEYPEGEIADPTEPLNRLVVRTRRGGAWYSPMREVRSAQRSVHFPHGRCGFNGLRLAIAPRLVW